MMFCLRRLRLRSRSRSFFPAISELFEVRIAHVLHECVVFRGGHVAVEIVNRVHRHALVDHLVVEVGARGDARVARFGDDLPAGDPFARLHEDFAQVCVAGLVAEFVVQQHHVSVAAVAPRGGDLHHGVARGVDRRAAVAAQVDALVGADIPQHGVHPA